MSLESLIFVLRALITLSLLGFLLALFIIVWRSLRQIDRRQAAGACPSAFLTRQTPGEPRTAGASERYALAANTTLGRSASNTIVVDDDAASAEHARIALEAGQWWLEDRRSRNGTSLNDAPVEKRAILADGDIISIGNARYRFSLEGGALSGNR